jgi:hypothetical protein
MKILHTVQDYFPSTGGSEEVVRQLSERLAKRGHEMTVATSRNRSRSSKIINSVKIEEFQLGGNIVNGIIGSKKEIRRYQDFIMRSDYDIIMNYAAQIWCTDLVFSLLKNINKKKFLVPCGYSGLGKKEYEILISSNLFF